MRPGRAMAVVSALLAATLAGGPAAHATGVVEVPAIGSITITDPGTGPRETWSYDGLLNCHTEVSGPTGTPQSIKVICDASQSPVPNLACPVMDVYRWTDTVVGARATCTTTLDMGVGTTGTAIADLGPVDTAITCEAYVDVGVLVPPYTVTCAEPGPPEVSL